MMFVVGIVCSYYDSDLGRRRSYYLDDLFETTEGAEKEIARMIYEKKKELWLQKTQEDCRNKFEKDFEAENPEPPNPRDNEGKPAFVHGLGKDYQREHEALVHKWYDEVQGPRRALWQSWIDHKRDFIKRNVEPAMAMMNDFIYLWKNEIAAVELSSYNDVKYTTKILEVFK